MPIRILCRDVLDTNADVLVLWTSPDSLGDFSAAADLDRILGTVGHQFRRRYPGAWTSIESALSDPSHEQLLRESGSAVLSVVEVGAPFSHVLLLSTLTHREGADLKSVGARAIASGLRVVFDQGLYSVAMTLPRGGWRLSLEDAYFVTESAFRSALSVVSKPERVNVRLEVCTRDEAEAAQLKTLLYR